MRDSRPLEFLLWRAAIVLGVSLVWGRKKERGGATDATDRALNLPGCTLRYFSDIPGYTKNPMSFDMGFSVQK